MTRTKHSKVMTIANNLVKQGYSRSMAMVKAWIIIKLKSLRVPVVGTTFGNRQKAIHHLERYPHENIAIELHREYTNKYDSNAVSVVANVKSKGSYVMGYLSKKLAALIAPLLDTGKAVLSTFCKVTGGKVYDMQLNYGLTINISI